MAFFCRCLGVVVFLHLAAAQISGVAKEQRVVDAAQDVLTAAIATDPGFVSSHEGILTSQRMVTKDFSFWTTGLDVEVEEEEDEAPPHRYQADDEDEGSGYDGTDYWDTFDRFAGRKSHFTMFAGFARHRLDMRNFEYAGKCPVPDCGSFV